MLRIVSGTVALAAVSLSALAGEVRLITLDPGHFHAGLVQKFMYPQVNPVVHVYSPGGPDLQEHLKRIEGFNTRAENPTKWDEKVYTGPDFLERMIQDRPGNVVVLSGNNARKTEYIDKAIRAGFNVYADKPMAITPQGFKLLRKTIERAEKNGLALYDIMTERFEITSILQRELAWTPEVFGLLQPGTPEHPGVVMESVHHFFKEVAGKPLIRPAWFFDVRQQGEAVPDVGTHLVDLVQWECFPEQALDWRKDIKVLGANRWPTKMTKAQFQRVTGLQDYPDYLRKDVGTDGVLSVFQNGDVTYQIKGINAKVTALWNFEAPAGTKDSHYSLLRGSKADLEIRQGAEQKYTPTLYVRPKVNTNDAEKALRAAVTRLAAKWPGLALKPAAAGSWEVTVPDKYNIGHEAHFAQVTENYLKYLDKGGMPYWEMPNILAKYYVSTEALRLALKNKQSPK
jgi:predicted dehydrogenase